MLLEPPTPTVTEEVSAKSAKVWKLVLLLSGLLLVSLLIFTAWPHYAATAVCTDCGQRRDYYDWNWRLGAGTLHRFTKDRSTVVSRALPVASRTTHSWTAPIPVIESPTEGSEPAPNLLYAVEAPRVGSFITDLARATKPEVLAKWKGFVLDPTYLVVLEPALRYMRFPEQGFANAAEFRAWWGHSEYPLWNHLREVTEPD